MNILSSKFNRFNEIFSHFRKLVPDGWGGFDNLERRISQFVGGNEASSAIKSLFSEICNVIIAFKNLSLETEEVVDQNLMGFAYFEVKSLFEHWQRTTNVNAEAVVDKLNAIQERYVDPLATQFAPYL